MINRIRLAFAAVLAISIGASGALAWLASPMMATGGTSGPPPQAVQSVSLSNSTFTNSTANAVVGTVSVVMNPASPAFSGTLAISGANSGGFHIVGSTLETNSGGTTSGTYTDITITATQAGATGSPSISPTLVGGSAGQIACDIGPPYQGAVPGPAAAMGFTHCVNFDFSYTGTFSNAVDYYYQQGTVHVSAGQTYQWSNIGSWFQNGHGLFSLNSGNTEPGQIQLVNDPSSPGGGQVLLLQVPPPGANDFLGSTIQSIDFPGTNNFTESIIKVNPNSPSYLVQSASGDGKEVFDDFSYPCCGLNGNGVETDWPISCASGLSGCFNSGIAFIEAFGSHSATGAGLFKTPNSINVVDGQYHSVGALAAASYSLQKATICGYVDHLQTSVQNGGGCQATWSFVNPSQNFCVEDPQVCGQFSEMTLGSYAQIVSGGTIQHWIQRITIWVGPGWNSLPPNTFPPANDSGNQPGFQAITVSGANGPSWP